MWMDSAGYCRLQCRKWNLHSLLFEKKATQQCNISGSHLLHLFWWSTRHWQQKMLILCRFCTQQRIFFSRYRKKLAFPPYLWKWWFYHCELPARYHLWIHNPPSTLVNLVQVHWLFEINPHKLRQFLPNFEMDMLQFPTFILVE